MATRMISAGAVLLVVTAGYAAAGETRGEFFGQAAADAQRKAAVARFHAEIGRKLFDSAQYEMARDELRKAQHLDPANEAARDLLRKVEDILGVRPASIETAAEEFRREEIIGQQSARMELQNLLQSGKEFFRKGEQPSQRELAVLTRGQILANSLRNFNTAIQKFERALEVMRWLPYKTDLGGYEEEARRLLKEALGAERKQRQEIREHKRALAAVEIEDRRAREEQFQKKKLNELEELADAAYADHDYDKAERLAQEILKVDPINPRAQKILLSSRELKLRERGREFRITREQEMTDLYDKLDAAGIPLSRDIVYPGDWEEISKRETAEEEAATEPQWMKDIRKQFDRRVTFEFVDTPLNEAIAFLQTLTKLTIILDPKAAEGGGASVPITLRVTNMELRLALKWILRLAGLDYTLKKEAIFISTPENLAGEVDLKIYDVRDLTASVTPFPGPEIVVGAGAGGGAGGAPNVAFSQEEVTATFEAGSIAELIQTRVKPDSWAPELGTSIEERGGKLVVMQRPEVHKLIGQLLKSFRESQTLQVVVQTRFIEVRDSFLEDIGIQFVDLPDTPAAPGETWAGTGGNTRLDTEHPNNWGGFFEDTTGFHWYEDSTATGTGGSLDGYTDVRLRSTAFARRMEPFGSRLGRESVTGVGSGQGLVMQFRFLGNIEANAILHALAKDEDGKLLMAPRITMYNNQRAHLVVCHQRAYIADYDISGGVYDPVIRTILTGTVLDVKPTVSHDRRYITLELRPGTADKLEFDETHSITVTIITGTGSAVYDLPIQLPSIQLRSVRTSCTLPDGGTLLLSGLMSDYRFDANSGIPLLSDLPVIGRLFGTDIRQREKSNLLILVTARLILFSEEEAKL